MSLNIHSLIILIYRHYSSEEAFEEMTERIKRGDIVGVRGHPGLLSFSVQIVLNSGCSINFATKILAIVPFYYFSPVLIIIVIIIEDMSGRRKYFI